MADASAVQVRRSLVDTSDPAPWFALMREREPVWFDEDFGLWHVFRAEDVQRALTDPAAFSSDARAQMAAIPEYGPFSQGNFMMMDGADHRRMRALVSGVFTRRAVEAVEPVAAAVVDELLDALAGREELDVVADLAHPLPVAVLTGLLGLPRGDSAKLVEWAKVLTGVDIEAAAPAADPLASLREMNAYLAERIAERRADPGDDLLSGLVTAQSDGTGLTDDEITGVVGLLLVAGHLMVTMLLANTVLCLDANPEAAARVRADRAAIPGAVEEVLRTRNSADRLVRTTTADVVLAGRVIPAGSRVLLWTGSANLDPNAVADPERFDIGRDPNRHGGFGQGPHFCLGAPLGRLQARVALTRLLDRTADIEVIGDDVEFFGSHSLIRRLPARVRWV